VLAPRREPLNVFRTSALTGLATSCASKALSRSRGGEAARVDLAPPISLDSRLAKTMGSSERGECDVSQAEGVEGDRRS
jgi:hypothetical protein